MAHPGRFFLSFSSSSPARLIALLLDLVNTVRVQNVYPNSPAAKAGLAADTDYILATPDTLLHDQVGFFSFL